MRFILLAIVLTFPVVDLIATVRFARWTGVPVWMWIAMSTTAGFVLLRNERVAFRANTAAAMHGEQFALRGLFDSGRKVLAGVLFILPGVVSDLMALILLALPLNVGHDLEPQTATAQRHRRPHAFDGESRRVD
jgi:UPF0716 protein FxsA